MEDSSCTAQGDLAQNNSKVSLSSEASSFKDCIDHPEPNVSKHKDPKVENSKHKKPYDRPGKVQI